MDGQEPNSPNESNNLPTQQEPDLPKAAPESSANYANYQKPGSNKSKGERNFKKPLIAFLIILVIAGVAFGAYSLFFKSKPNSNQNKSTTSESTPQPEPSSTTTTATKHYDSSNFNLGFDYPEDWKVAESSDGNKLTVTSPSMQLTDKDGKSTTGQTVMTIRNNQQPLTEFDKGNATAVRQSEKVAYAKPSQSQRANTYLSFLLYAGSTGSNGDYDGVYITGDNGYQKDQAIPKVDIAKVDPLINITYVVNNKPITVADNMWDNPNYSKPVKTMLQSLAIQ